MNKRGIALAQIIILTFGIIAISYSVGSEIKLISGKTETGVIFPGKNIPSSAPNPVSYSSSATRIGDVVAQTKYTEDIGKATSIFNFKVEGIDPKKFLDGQKEIYETAKKTFDTSVAKAKTDFADNPSTFSGETGTTAGDWLASKGWSAGSANAVGHIASGLAWATTVAGVGAFIASFAGLEEDQTNAISTAMGMGTFTGTT